jgi:SAM-dependent methyltransferase
MRQQKPNYGQDAPGLMRGFATAAAVGFAMAAAATLLPNSSWRIAAPAILIVVSAYPLGMALLMMYGSRRWKIRHREVLLDELNIAGNDHALDVGCGRGLLLVGIALRLTTGRATGVDLWSAVDQSGNRPETAINNARLEGVADRVTVKTGDVRKMPFADRTFDVVTSHWVIHNLPAIGDRRAALAEIHRVLKPGGRHLIADISNLGEYKSSCASLGFVDIRHIGPGLPECIWGLVSFGSFRPAALAMSKAGGDGV